MGLESVDMENYGFADENNSEWRVCSVVKAVRNDREDCEKMAGKGEPQRSKKNCKLKRGGKEKRLTKD